MNVTEVTGKVRGLMPDILADLARLVACRSVSFSGFPADQVAAARAETIDVLKKAGFTGARELDLGAGYPPVWADVAGPAGAPTVLLYAHYDVQPAPDGTGWETDPWTLTKKDDGRYYGRGAADNKSGIVMHAGLMHAFDGRPPVHLKLCVEGEEETLSNLEGFIKKNPDLFRADVMVIADMGNISAGEPALTTTLRGNAVCVVEVSTLPAALHSGVFGGPVPDALVALIRMLAALWDERGKTVVPGLRSSDWSGAPLPEELYREMSGLPPDVELIGDGSLASRLWSKPSVNVIGIDAPAVAGAANILIPQATAMVSLRLAPGEDPDKALDDLVSFLNDVAPWSVRVDIAKKMAADPFEAPVGGPAFQAAERALALAYGKEPSAVGSGGTIPLLKTLADASPNAEFILWGASDTPSRIHGANESVDPSEIAKMIIAQTLLIQDLGNVSKSANASD